MDNPYDAFLNRVVAASVPSNSIYNPATYNPNAGNDVISTGQTLRDVTIDTWIKSVNYYPKKQGFFFDGQTGDITAASAYITGTINALLGKLGSDNNYWSIGSKGLTAVFSDGDVMINYGKTDFGQDASSGFIIGYDFSALASKIEIGSSASKLFKYDGVDLSLIGGTVTSGTIRTGTSGARVQIGGITGVGSQINDAFFFDDTTGGITPVTGNYATIYFPRTDDGDPFNDTLSTKSRFLIQKRKPTTSNNGNVQEFYFDQFAPSPALNYIYVGRKGSAIDMYTNILSLNAYDGIELGLHGDADTIAHFRYNTSYPNNYWIKVNMKGNPIYFDDAHTIQYDGASWVINSGDLRLAVNSLLYFDATHSLQYTGSYWNFNSGSVFTPGDSYAGGNLVANSGGIGAGDIAVVGGTVVANSYNSTTSDSGGTPAHTHGVTMWFPTMTVKINGVVKHIVAW